MHRKSFVCAVLMAAIGSAVSVASAAIVNYNINTVFSGPGSVGTRPYVTLQFDDEVAPGIVRMTAAAPGLSVESLEFVSQLNLNLDPAFDVADLTFSNFTILSGTLLQPVLQEGNNSLEAGGGGLFDYQLDFARAGGPGLSRRWSAGEIFTVDIEAEGLTANSFDFLSSPPAPNGIKLLAVRIEFFEGQDRGFHTIPEPASASLALFGLAGITLRRRLR